VTERVLIDTGPLVAILRAREVEPARCVEALKTLRPPLLTCWPVMTEAAWLLRNEPGGVSSLGRLVEGNSVALLDPDARALVRIISYMDRYASIGARLADAALFHLAEREGVETAFTLDRRDFSGYRTTDGRALRILPEA